MLRTKTKNLRNRVDEKKIFNTLKYCFIDDLKSIKLILLTKEKMQINVL